MKIAKISDFPDSEKNIIIQIGSDKFAVDNISFNKKNTVVIITKQYRGLSIATSYVKKYAKGTMKVEILHRGELYTKLASNSGNDESDFVIEASK